MAKQSFKTAVGAFVIGGLTLLLAGIILLGGGRMFSDDIEYVLYFDGSVSGLSIGAPVVFRGVPMGQVTRIRPTRVMPASPSRSTSGWTRTASSGRVSPASSRTTSGRRSCAV